MHETAKAHTGGASRLMCAAMASLVAVACAGEDEPSWPEGFDANVASLVSAALPSGSQAASVQIEAVQVAPSVAASSAGTGSLAQPFDSCYRVSGLSSGINMCSFPVGSVICIR